MKILNICISIHHSNHCTQPCMYTENILCIVIKISLNGLALFTELSNLIRVLKESESESMPLNQPQNPLCKILLYLILFFYFGFHIWDSVILSLSNQFALSHFNNQGSLMVGFRLHLRGVQQCLWKALSGNHRTFSLLLSHLISSHLWILLLWLSLDSGELTDTVLCFRQCLSKNSSHGESILFKTKTKQTYR